MQSDFLKSNDNQWSETTQNHLSLPPGAYPLQTALNCRQRGELQIKVPNKLFGPFMGSSISVTLKVQPSSSYSSTGGWEPLKNLQRMLNPALFKKLLQIKNSSSSRPCRCWRVSAGLKGGKCQRDSLRVLQHRWKVAFQSAGKTSPRRLERKLLASQQPPAESHCTAETARCFASGPCRERHTPAQEKRCLRKAKSLGAQEKNLAHFQPRLLHVVSPLLVSPHTASGLFFHLFSFPIQPSFSARAPLLFVGGGLAFLVYFFVSFSSLKLSSTLIYLSASKNENWLRKLKQWGIGYGIPKVKFGTCTTAGWKARNTNPMNHEGTLKEPLLM